MNHKQKLGYTLLGAGIMALGIAIGQFITPNIEAQNNGVFDKITCRELQVVNKDGSRAIVLNSHEDAANGVIIYNPAGEGTVVLVATEQQSELAIYNPAGVKAVSLFNDSEILTNSVEVYNQTGGRGVVLYSMKGSNGVIVTDQEGKAIWARP